MKTTKTLPCYRFYALPGTQPPKPGLVREEGFEGPGIEVEVWAVPENEFGSFVAGVPPPLGIGSATLENGEVVKCFICEPYGLRDAMEITQFRRLARVSGESSVAGECIIGTRLAVAPLPPESPPRRTKPGPVATRS